MPLLIFLLVVDVLFFLSMIYCICRAVHRADDGKENCPLWERDMPFSLEEYPSLVLPAEAKQIKILLISDPQLKCVAFPSRDRRTLELIKRAVLAEKPTLCVVTGDLVFSIFTFGTVKRFARFMHRLGAPWAFTFGNHDAQCDCSKQTISKLLAKYPNCLYSVGPRNVEGYGNYLVNIFLGSKSAEKLMYSLVMLDSGMYAPQSTGKFCSEQMDWLRTSQMEWYKWAVAGLQKIRPNVQSSMFFHIPLKEFANMYYLNLAEEEVPTEVKNKLPKVEIADVTGTVCELKKSPRAVVCGDEGYTAGIYYQGNASGADHPDVFAVIKQMQCTKGVFCAHDHVNTLRGHYDGIYLCYGLCSGYHTYPYFKKFPSENVALNGALWVDENGQKQHRGVTVITVSLEENYGTISVRNVTDTDLA